MQSSLIIAISNQEKKLPSLLKSIQNFQSEIILLDQNSSDSSWKIIDSFAQKNKNSRALRSKNCLAEILNEGIAAAKGEAILFLDSNAIPSKKWEESLLQSLLNHDLVVGNTITAAGKGPYADLANKLFENHSERTAQAKGHALPWGTLSNLGAKKTLFASAGIFSKAAGEALDIDWCWRAMLNRAQIAFEPKATIKLTKKIDKLQLLKQFDQFGKSESWLHKTYAFLTDSESSDPLLTSIDAYERLRYHSKAAKVKRFQKPLEEIAVAFSSGVRAGLERLHPICPIKRELKKSIAWNSEKNEITILVPGKGLATLQGKQTQLWTALAQGASTQELANLFVKLFKIAREEALHEAVAFRESLSV